MRSYAIWQAAMQQPLRLQAVRQACCGAGATCSVRNASGAPPWPHAGYRTWHLQRGTRPGDPQLDSAHKAPAGWQHHPWRVLKLLMSPSCRLQYAASSEWQQAASEHQQLSAQHQTLVTRAEMLKHAVRMVCCGTHIVHCAPRPH